MGHYLGSLTSMPCLILSIPITAHQDIQYPHFCGKLFGNFKFLSFLKLKWDNSALHSENVKVKYVEWTIAEIYLMRRFPLNDLRNCQCNPIHTERTIFHKAFSFVSLSVNGWMPQSSDKNKLLFFFFSDLKRYFKEICFDISTSWLLTKSPRQAPVWRNTNRVSYFHFK